MRRREFITALGGAAAMPLTVFAQSKLPTIGFLGTASASAWAAWTSAFYERLRQLGWIEQRTVAIETRWAEGHSERLAELAAELVRLKVDIIVTSGSGVPAAKRATSNLPIVFAISPDPVGGGLVPSLSRPGGNVTGFSTQVSDLAGKRLELLREIIPSLSRLAIMANVSYPAALIEMNQADAAARRLGIEPIRAEVRQPEKVLAAFEAFKDRVGGLYVCADPTVNTSRVRINTLALTARLPTMLPFRDFVQVGGLMSYGPNFSDLFRRTAEYVDKILKGAKPADMPVQQPTKFDLIFNLTTAKALGLKISDTFLLRADEVIE